MAVEWSRVARLTPRHINLSDYGSRAQLQRPPGARAPVPEDGYNADGPVPNLKRAIRRATVTPIRPLGHVATGQAALRRGAWKEAKRHFQAALAHGDQPEAQ